VPDLRSHLQSKEGAIHIQESSLDGGALWIFRHLRTCNGNANGSNSTNANSNASATSGGTSEAVRERAREQEHEAWLTALRSIMLDDSSAALFGASSPARRGCYSKYGNCLDVDLDLRCTYLLLLLFSFLSFSC
jgi:hypothetical protein